jgi:hypothetical protein
MVKTSGPAGTPVPPSVPVEVVTPVKLRGILGDEVQRSPVQLSGVADSVTVAAAGAVTCFSRRLVLVLKFGSLP